MTKVNLIKREAPSQTMTQGYEVPIAAVFAFFLLAMIMVPIFS